MFLAYCQFRFSNSYWAACPEECPTFVQEKKQLPFNTLKAKRERLVCGREGVMMLLPIAVRSMQRFLEYDLF